VITGARKAWDKVHGVNKMEDRKDVSDRNLPPGLEQVSEGWSEGWNVVVQFRWTPQ